MNDIENHKTRKRGEFTTDDVIKESRQTIQVYGAKRMVVIIQDDSDVAHRFNTELDDVELSGLMEVAKISEFCE